MLRRDWNAQAMDVIADWAQREDAPQGLRKPAEGLAEVRTVEAKAPRYNIVVPRSACEAVIRRPCVVARWSWLIRRFGFEA